MSDVLRDWTEVIPGRGELKETAQLLLAIAGDPSLVRTEGNGTTFLVPRWVADSFVTPAPPPPSPRKRAPRAPKTEE